jgi:hypothetical protein
MISLDRNGMVSRRLSWGALLAEVQEKSARLHLTAVMLIRHRTAITQWKTRRNQTDGQFGKSVVAL